MSPFTCLAIQVHNNYLFPCFQVLAEFRARSEKEERQEEAIQATEDSDVVDSDDEVEEETHAEQFMDSEEEISYLGSVEERRQKSVEDSRPPSKKSKTAD